METATMMKDLQGRMEGAVSVLKQEFSGLRTGRATPDLLAPVTVDAYGSVTPLNQVGSVSAADARCLTVQVWDSGLVSAVEKAIRDSGLGLNPSVDGNTLRINLPELNEERRQELIKVARKYAESARVSVRNVRRDGNDGVKKMEVGEDEARKVEAEIQKLTDRTVSQIDEMLKGKEADILKV